MGTKKNNTTFDLLLSSLKHRANNRLTAKELAQFMIEDHPDWAEKKKAKSQNLKIKNGDLKELQLQVQREVAVHKKRIEAHSSLRITEDRPRKYYFTELSDSEEIIEAERKHPPGENQLLTEHDLYPLLADYLRSEHGVYAKRIDEKKSKNSQGQGGNRWLHPDLIGFEAKSEGWSDTIRDLVRARSDPSSRLWSFEVKKKINRANLREVFFQTLSNSAWANLSYLVAQEISGKGTLDELRILSSQHGVGVIQLNAELPEESVVLIQAVEKLEIDWDAADRLSDENVDAKKVFEQVKVYHMAGALTKEFWDA